MIDVGHSLNILRKNKLTMTRGEVGWSHGGGGRVVRNMCKGHMDKIKAGWDQGCKVGMAGMGGEW